MSRGEAKFVDPESSKEVATFIETCEHDGSGHGRVMLRHPITLSGSERFAVYGTTKDEELISVTAKNGQDTKVREFGGKLALGCLPEGAEISLTKSPGGPLGTLLVVLGKGTVHHQ